MSQAAILGTRPSIADFEGSDAQAHGSACAQAAYMFWRGRVALYGILRSLGLRSGEYVLVPGYTCFAVPCAVLFAGGIPLYIDIEAATLNVSLRTIQQALHRRPGSIRAAIVQHSYGLAADLEPIVAWCRGQGIAVIEDCAHCLGARYRTADGAWHELGTLGDAAFFSSQWTKPVSTGLGGWAIAGNPAIATELERFYEEECQDPTLWEKAILTVEVKVRELASSPRICSWARSLYQALYSRGIIAGTSLPEEFSAAMPRGYAKRMSSFQMRLLARRVAEAQPLLSYRRYLKRFYDAALQRAGLPMWPIPDYADPVLLRYPIRVRAKQRAIVGARRKGIELGEWYNHPVDLPTGSSADKFCYAAGTCPEGERAAREVVNLPMHMGVNEETAQRAVEFIREFA